MKKQRNFLQALTLVLAVLVASCTTPQELLQTGQYDASVVEALKKLEKKNKKRKHVETVEDAFRRVTEKDMKEIEHLKAENRDENWVEIHRLHRRIKDRQELMEPYLPLVAKDGYHADFRFVKINPLELESRTNAAEYFYTHAKDLLNQSEKEGNKLAAREAYADLMNTERYFDNYKNKDLLVEKALALGLNRILFKMENQSDAIIPADFEREIMSISVRDFNDRWNEYHLNPEAFDKFDYNIVMKLRRIQVGRETLKEREYVDSKRVKDGFDYVLDQNGNVQKDTLGNDIKVDRYVDIYATVFESLQLKDARVGGTLEIFDNYTNELIRTEDVNVIADFEHYASTYRGDYKALSGDSRRHLGNRPVPFPSDEEMVLLAADNLKPAIIRELKGYSNYVSR